MARKKPMQFVPLEERPEFLALVAELVNVLPEQFPAIAQQCVDKYADAVLAGHVEVLDQMERAYKALVYKLNGETMFGCGAESSSAANVLARAVAAEPGQVPTWGQCGEFLLEVEGMRIRVQFKSNMLGNHHSCDLHAVDLDRPFLSTTGYRNAGVTAASCLGESVEQAVRRMVLDLLQNEGKPKPIVVDQFSKAAVEKRPQWLADALAGVRTNGQLAMFGDAPKDPAAKVPLSNAERQKALRQRRKAQQLKPVMLSEAEQLWLDHVRQQFAGAPSQGVQGQDFAALEVTDARLLAVWESLPSDFSRAATALGLLRLRNSQHAELARAVEVLQDRLRGAGLRDRITLDKKEWYWNESPPADYRASTAPEYMERRSRQLSVADDRAELLQRISSLEEKNRELETGRDVIRHYWQARADQAEAELAYLRGELQEIGGVMAESAPVINSLDGKPMDLPHLQSEVRFLVCELNKATAEVGTLTDRLKAAGLQPSI